MKLQYKHISLLLLFILTIFFAKSQVAESKVKVQYIYKFTENITWQHSAFVDTFHIVYLGDDSKLMSYLKLIERKKINGYPVRVSQFNNADDINYKQVHLLYVENVFNENVVDIFNSVKGNNTLLITDNFPRQKFVMINFTRPDSKTISFEVNRRTIFEQNLKISDKLVLLGGKEIDLLELYKKQEVELDKERENVEKQKLEIEELNKNIKVKQAELVEKENVVKAKVEELKIQAAKLKAQKKILDEIKKEVSRSKNLLTRKILDLKKKENEIKKQNAVIKEQNQKVEKAKIELAKVNDEIKKKKQELELKEAEIAKKEKALIQRDLTIDSQQNILVIGGIVLFIILLLSVLLAKMIRSRNKANKILEFKNTEISNKNKEINSQKEELQAQKGHIEAQYQETQASISYAQTIQNAILPASEDISKYIDNFILFRPKDVVSGDFFWFAHLPAKGEFSEKLFIAAVDCTGHGVPGAFMSMIGNRLLNEIVNEKKITNTAQILDELNNNIKKSLKQETSDNRDGMDMCLCKIEKADNEKTLISFSGAKRPLHVYNSKNKVIIEYKGDRKSIGGNVSRNSYKTDFTVTEIICSKNDLIYLSTDGYIDQNDQNRKRFGTNKFTETIGKVADKSLEIQKQFLENELDKHQKGTLQRDDITVIGIKF